MHNLLNIHIKGIPALILYKKQSSGLQPIIFLFHKLLQNKTNELSTAFILSEQGYFVVLPDMVAHGERKESKDQWDYNLNNLFKDIYQTANDVQTLIDYLHEEYKDQLSFNYITAVGVSIGASVALASSCVLNEIKNVACLIGAVNWEFMITQNMFNAFSILSSGNRALDTDMLMSDIRKYEPFTYLKPKHFPSILFLNGGLDSSLLLKASRNYYNELIKFYTSIDKNEKLTMVELKKTGHDVNDAMLEYLLQWLNTTHIKSDSMALENF